MSQRYIGGLIYNPPGGFSGYFVDTSSSYLSIASSSIVNFGTGDFTAEAWVYLNVVDTSIDTIISNYNNGSNGGLGWYINRGSNGGVQVYSGNSLIATAASAVTAGSWNHIAICRASGTLRIFINGAIATSVSDSSNYGADNSATGVGGTPPGSGAGAYLPGYLSNVRVVKGTAVYTAAFTPPNGPLQAITNTSLLTCAYSTFRDGSTNNFTITVNGNTAVSTQNPFPLTTLPNPALGNQGNGVYSMSQYQSLLSQNLWPAVDPYWRYVTLMLHGNGTNGAQNNTFLDSSTNNFTITRNGNTTQGTFAPYGSNWSNYFDGSGDQLSAPVGAISSVGSSDFSIECFVYFLRNTNTFAQGLVSYGVAGSTTGTSFLSFQTDPSGYPAVAYATGSSLTLTSSVLPSTNQWTHLVVCRSGSTLSIFVNGVRAATTTTSATVGASGDALTIGGQWFANNSGRQLQGYISNARIVRGSSAYDATQSNITVPSAPLTAITNTSLLTCQSNRFIDNSANAFSITVNGDTSVQRFSPFAPTAPYAASTDGGSGYFDGTGDYLDISSNSVLTPSGDFTIEFWAYPTSASGIREWYSKGNGIQVFSNGTAWSLALSSNNSGTYFINASFGTLVANQWQHVVVTRSGNSYVGFVNGVATSLGTSSSAPSTGTDVLRIGDFSVSAIYPVVGYMSGVRFVNGTAVYGTSTFTPPTTPPIAVTNTQLLTNFTNAGIIDNAEMNNLETVGNAQISTAQSKFGGASMAFDGSGDYLVQPYNQGQNFGTGNFTIEGWFYLNSLANAYYVLGGTWSVENSNEWLIQIQNNGSIRFLTTAGTSFYSAGITTGTWYHFAAVRSGTTVTLYINGTSVGSYTNSNSIGSTAVTTFWGIQNASSWPWNGYIDDLRITKGYARYTANFTPQRSQWQDQ